MLDRVGFDGHIINLIKSMHKETEATYEFKGIMEELIQSVKKAGVGIKINPCGIIGWRYE